MNKILTILFAALIMISGMHPAVSTHFCGGHIAAVKWSFSGENATCGMTESHNVPEGTILKELCCENEKAVFSTDENYAPSMFSFNFTSELTLLFILPANELLTEAIATAPYFYTGSPPGDAIAGKMTLSGLCTFRI